MRILTLESGFPPELTSSRIPYEFARSLAERGHEVIVATVPPRKHAVSTEEVGRPSPRKETVDGFLVLRLGVSPGGTSISARIAEYFLVPLFLLGAGVKVPRPDVIHAGSPPLLVGLVAVFLGRLKQRPVVLRIQDVHPDALIRLGLIKNRWLIRGLEFVARFAYLNADKVAGGGETYRRHVLRRGTHEAAVTVIHNWMPSIPPTNGGGEGWGGLGWAGKVGGTCAGTMAWPEDVENPGGGAGLGEKGPGT